MQLYLSQYRGIQPAQQQRPPSFPVSRALFEWTVGCRPVCLEGLLDIKAEHNAAKLVVGNTEVGIELKFKHAGYPVLVGTTHVPELNTIEASQGLMHCRRLRESLLLLQESCWMNSAVPVSFPVESACWQTASPVLPQAKDLDSSALLRSRCLMTPWWSEALSR